MFAGAFQALAAAREDTLLHQIPQLRGLKTGNIEVNSIFQFTHPNFYCQIQTTNFDFLITVQSNSPQHCVPNCITKCIDAFYPNGPDQPFVPQPCHLCANNNLTTYWDLFTGTPICKNHASKLISIHHAKSLRVIPDPDFKDKIPFISVFRLHAFGSAESKSMKVMRMSDMELYPKRKNQNEKLLRWSTDPKPGDPTNPLNGIISMDPACADESSPIKVGLLYFGQQFPSSRSAARANSILIGRKRCKVMIGGNKKTRENYVRNVKKPPKRKRQLQCTKCDQQLDKEQFSKRQRLSENKDNVTCMSCSETSKNFACTGLNCKNLPPQPRSAFPATMNWYRRKEMKSVLCIECNNAVIKTKGYAHDIDRAQ
jgi:hypothetical protein